MLQVDVFVLYLALTEAGARALSTTGVPVDYGWTASIQALLFLQSRICCGPCSTLVATV